MDIESRLPPMGSPPVVSAVRDDTSVLGGNAFGEVVGEKPAAPGRGPELVEQLDAAAAALDEASGAIAQLGDEQLTRLMGILVRLRTRADQVGTVVACEAVTRDTVKRSDAASTTQWVTACAVSSDASIEPRDASRIAAVAEACCDRRNHVIASAVARGSCTLDTARTALRETEKVAAVIPAAERGEIHGWFLQLDPSLGSRGVTELTRRLLAVYAPHKLCDTDAKLEKVESLTWRTLPTGMLRLIADLSPANAARLKAAISTLSAPRPATAGAETTSGEVSADGANAPAARATDAADAARGDMCGTSGDASTAGTAGRIGGRPGGPSGDGSSAERRGLGGPTDKRVLDERSPGKRRADALLDLVSAGARAAAGEGAPVGAAATVLVTMDIETLIGQLGGATTVTGEVLDAEAARRMACDAEIIPMVLGSASEPLDVGRRERLVTKGMRAAVPVRDRGCSFPGCDRPPGFCEVHHVVPWWAGGETSLGNSAMLCCRHHQIVHRQGYVATVTADGVIWDLTPGRLGNHRQGVAA